MGRKRVKPQVGDIFLVPLNGGGQDEHGPPWGVGKIVAPASKTSSDPFIVAGFSHVAQTADDAEAAIDSTRHPPALLFQTLATLFTIGRWQIIGHEPAALTPFSLGASRAMTNDGWVLVDASGQWTRAATEDEVNRVPFRSTRGPVALEHGLRALAGMIEWDPSYDDLRPPPPELTSAALFPGLGTS